MTLLDDLQTTLEQYVERCEEELNKAKSMLHVLKFGPGPDQPRLDEQPKPKKPAKAKVAKKASSSNGGGSDSVSTTSRSAFTDEEKANVVDRAAELGSNAAAGREAGVTGQTVADWKRQGFGSAAI